jgi:hypothetical protein
MNSARRKERSAGHHLYLTMEATLVEQSGSVAPNVTGRRVVHVFRYHVISFKFFKKREESPIYVTYIRGSLSGLRATIPSQTLYKS